MLATTRRPRRGVTLMEVMIATAILAVGLTAIMALFPIGAVNFARAINQDRSATHGVNEDAVFRYYWKKAWVQREFVPVGQPPTYYVVPTGSICATNEDAYYNSQEPMLLMLEAHPFYGIMNLGVSQPSFPVLVDPVGWHTKSGSLNEQGFVAGNRAFPVRTTLREVITTGNPATDYLRDAPTPFPATQFPRQAPFRGDAVNPGWYPTFPKSTLPGPDRYNPAGKPEPYQSFNSGLRVRLTTLLDDLTFDGSGEAAAPTLQLERAGRYTASWLIQRSRNDNPSDVEVKVLVYGGRSPTDTPSAETAYSADVVSGTKSMLITLGGQGPPALRSGAWVAFWVPVPPIPVPPGAPQPGTTYPALEFYRVVGVVEDPTNPDRLLIEVETPFKTYLTIGPAGSTYTGAAIVFDNLIEVFDRGTVTPHSTSTK